MLRTQLRSRAGRELITTVHRRSYPLDSDARTLQPSHPAPKTLPRLAVLPFETPDDSPRLASLCGGLMEELIAQLARLQQGALNVIARGSVARYTTPRRDLADIARTLRLTTCSRRARGSRRADSCCAPSWCGAPTTW